MNIPEALQAVIPRKHPYASTIFPETIYAAQGIEIQTRKHLSSSLTTSQQKEIKRLSDAGVTFYDRDKGYHLSLVEPYLTYSLDGNKGIISADAGEGDYVVSRALVRPSFFRRSEKKLPIEAKTVGAGIVVRTSDGKFIGVTRSYKNGNYSGFREVSASGGITIEHVTPDTPITDVIEATMREEIQQEMKLSPDEVTAMKIMPIVMVKDERLPHFGIGFVGQSTKTSDEIIQGQNVIAENDNTPHDFSESLHVVGGTPDEVRAYILDSSLPLTGSAREMWLAAGARLIFETQYFDNGTSQMKAQEIAETWRQQVREEAKQLYNKFDREVRKYYRRHREAVKETSRPDKPRRYWTGGIDPAAPPYRQGIGTKPQEETIKPTFEVAA